MKHLTSEERVSRTKALVTEERRAARLVRDVPEAKAALATGRLSLSNASAVRRRSVRIPRAGESPLAAPLARLAA